MISLGNCQKKKKKKKKLFFFFFFFLRDYPKTRAEGVISLGNCQKKKKKKGQKNKCLHDVSPDDRSAPQLVKGWGVCYHVYMTSAHKRTYVDHQNIPNHHTSICSYHVWVCVWMAAMKAIVPRGSACCLKHATCMLPRELIWERVAPSHTGMTQSKVIGLGCKMWSGLKSLWLSSLVAI